jgi:hypothetical protein
MEGSGCGLWYCPSICLEELRKSTKTSVRSVGQDLILGPSEYKAVVLTTHLQCLVMSLQMISLSQYKL